MQITLRIPKGVKLTHEEGDNNIVYLDKKMTISTIAPDVTDDSTKNFTANESLWMNTTTGFVYECTDTTIGAAVWAVRLQDTTYTASEIKTMYESNADTNAFTDALLAKLTTLYGSDINVANTIGTPTHIDTTDKLYNHFYSSGIMHGCDITSNGDGTIDVSTGFATMREPLDTGHGTIYSVEVPAVASLALTDNSTNFVYASYNDGITILWVVTLDPSDINLIDTIPAYIVVRSGNNIAYLDARNQNVNHIAKNQIREFYTEPVKRKGNGVLVADAGTLHIESSAGTFFFQLDEYDVPALDTTGTDTFKYYYHVAGAWTEVDASVIDNLQYDDGTDLVTLANNKYGVHWIYAIIGSSPKYAVVYSTQEYTDATSAESANPPISLPASLTGLGVLIGRAIVQKSATELSAVESSFDTTFSFSPASLTNYLQQGLVDTTANRPVGSLTGTYHWDTTLGIPIWWNGTAWTNGAGTVV